MSYRLVNAKNPTKFSITWMVHSEKDHCHTRGNKQNHLSFTQKNKTSKGPDIAFSSTITSAHTAKMTSY